MLMARMLWNASRTWAAIRQRNRQRPLAAPLAVRWLAPQRLLPIGTLRQVRERQTMPSSERVTGRVNRQSS